jgi:hypothetical protein
MIRASGELQHELQLEFDDGILLRTSHTLYSKKQVKA